MRFAASAPITDFLSQSIDMGALSQAGAQTRSAIKNAGTELEGKVGASGVTAAGEVEAAGILSEAQAALANAQGNAAMMGAIGDVVGSGIGAFSSMPKWEDGMPTGTGIGGFKNSYGGFGREKYGTFTDPTDSINSYLSTTDFFKR